MKLGDDDDDCYPIGRDILSECILYHFKNNTITGLEAASSLSMTFNAIGRAGEAGWVSYEPAEWNDIEKILYCKWNESKTTKTSPMSFYVDYSTWKLDFYFLHFCFRCTGGGDHYTRSMVYLSQMERKGDD